MYGIFDVLLDSDLPLPELPERDWYGFVIRICMGSPRRAANENMHWFHDWKDSDGEICISIGRIDEDYLLRFPALADMRVSGQGDLVEYFPAPGVPAETVRHLLLDQVVPRILGQQGRLVLHASAVGLPGGKVVVFLGGSGWGKSTIAASYHQAGARLITDDCLLLEVVDGNLTCIPNYYGVRLFKDSAEAIFGVQQAFAGVAHYSDKKRLVLPKWDGEDFPVWTPIDAMFLLADPERNNPDKKVIIEAVGGANELMVLLEQMFVLDVTDKSAIVQQFKNTGRIVAVNPAIYRLEYPHDHSLLPKVQTSINRTLG